MIYSQMLGLTPVEPGFTKIRVAPRILPVVGPSGVLAQFTIPAGNLTVTWRRSYINDTAATSTTFVWLPVGVSAEVLIPFIGLQPSSFIVYDNGAQVWNPAQGGLQPGIAGVVNATQQADGVLFELLSGSHSLAVVI